MDIGRLTRRVPAVHQLLRTIYRHVTGRALDEKFEQISAKVDRIERALGADQALDLGASSLVFVMEQSLEALRTPPPLHEGALALVSVLPPERTGVAHFSLEAFSAAEFPVDFYCPHLGLSEYLMLSARMASKGARHRILPLALLPYGLSTTHYAACVFVLGNSDHHLPTYRALKLWGRMGTPSIVHLHDPCLWNLVSSSRPGESIADILRPSYPSVVPPRGVVAPQEATRLGALGSRVLLASIGLRGIIVNSQAAREILATELPEMPVRTVFHPIFEQTSPSPSGQISRRTPGALRIGSFGLAGSEKCTETVLAAFAELRKRNPGAELILAGYGAPVHARTSSLGPEQGVFASEPATAEELIELMASCDVAIQLRRRNLGESSGIMAQLMRAGTPVVATDIGAFRDYHGAARLMPPDSTPLQIAAALIEEAGNQKARASEASRLIEERSPAHFCRAFCYATQALLHTAPTETRSAPDQ